MTFAWPDPQPSWPTDDLLLRAWRAEDVDQITAMCQDENIVRFTRVPHPYSRSDAEAFVERMAVAWRDRQAIGCAVVSPTEPERILASVGVVRIDAYDRVGEVGYMTAPHARGGHVMHRALVGFTRVCVSELGFARLECLVEVGNAASERTALSAGFVREGVLRSRLEQRGQRRDAMLFACVATPDRT